METNKRIHHGKHQVIVLILPMRNGNSNNLSCTTSSFSGSYPTYEEWKLIIPPHKYLSTLSSYPTYEEWKLFNGSIFHNFILSSYPTYEEWKQFFYYFVVILFFLFLSYLWGMETINMYKTIDARYKFLSYLWGMETTKNFRRRLTRLSSYPTYEEWKHLWYCFRKILILSSYPTYEEWKQQ